MHVKDSIVVRERKDTVWMERWRTEWTERTVTDTVIDRKVDTVCVVRTVNEHQDDGDRLLGGRTGWLVALVLLVVMVVYIVIKTFLKG